MIPLEFTPLEFETDWSNGGYGDDTLLEFTPLEFETGVCTPYPISFFN